MPLKHVFLMDPLESLSYEKDTTVALMEAAQALGHSIYYLAKDGLSVVDHSVLLNLDEVKLDRRKKMPFTVLNSTTVPARDVNVIWIRTDPPFDDTYLTHTWILDLVPDSVKVLNSPSGIREVNEKLWSLQFHDIIVDTLLTQSFEKVGDFIKDMDMIILKPIDYFWWKRGF